MNRFLSAALVFVAIVVSTRVTAGPNSQGVILLHYSSNLECSTDIITGRGGLISYDHAVVQAPVGVDAVVAYAYAAFPPGNTPRYDVITFGVSYSTARVQIADFGSGSDFDLGTTSPAWPQPGSGDAVEFDVPQTDTLKEFYWFCVYAFHPGELSLAPHPTQGGNFTDDSIPSQTDEIIDYGSMGFGFDGHRAVPGPGATGACCRTDGSCTLATFDQCGSLSYWVPGITACDPNPCPSLGACCLADGSCAVEQEKDCVSPGQWIGIGAVCAPTPCQAPLPGGCCRRSGHCVLVHAEECIFPDQWMGYGSTCDPVNCPPPRGACCNEDGTCIVAVEVGCNGAWLGPGTLCVPSPCNLQNGACCPMSGICWISFQAHCLGAWTPGLACDPRPCAPGPMPVIHSTWGRIKGRYR